MVVLGTAFQPIAVRFYMIRQMSPVTYEKGTAVHTCNTTHSS